MYSGTPARLCGVLHGSDVRLRRAPRSTLPYNPCLMQAMASRLRLYEKRMLQGVIDGLQEHIESLDEGYEDEK